MNGRDRFRIQQARSQGEQDESVPLYRSYGVKRRLRPWTEKIQLTFGKIILVWMACVLVLAACMCVVAFWLYFPEMWIKVVLSVVVALLVSVRLTRTVRKRRRLCKKLKKLCRQQHYRLIFTQNFFQSLFWSGNREDFVLETGSCVYYVRYLTVRKYRSILYFEKPESLRLVSRPLNNKFTLIFDVQPKVKHYPIDWGDKTTVWNNKRVVKALIINPVCAEMQYKKRDGGYESTGNGGEHFGYTVFTGSGFLETVRRNEEKPSQKNRY